MIIQLNYDLFENEKKIASNKSANESLLAIGDSNQIEQNLLLSTIKEVHLIFLSLHVVFFMT